MDCYTPYPGGGGGRGHRLPSQQGAAGDADRRPDGAGGHVLLETWVSVLAYPLNIAGRPTYSWPAFIVPAYEWTILWAGLSAAFGMLALNGLPSLYHPLFNAPNFRDGATTDKFFLCLEALDPKFDLVEARAISKAFSRFGGGGGVLMQVNRELQGTGIRGQRTQGRAPSFHFHSCRKGWAGGYCKAAVFPCVVNLRFRASPQVSARFSSSPAAGRTCRTSRR
jgi:hypothetical protein